MASDQEKREKLLQFLDAKAFNPVLRAPEKNYSGKRAEKLDHVKRATEKEKERFHNNYKSAKEVKDNFRSDLTSSPAKKVHKELEELNLPALPQLEQEFMELCEKLEV